MNQTQPHRPHGGATTRRRADVRRPTASGAVALVISLTVVAAAVVVVLNTVGSAAGRFSGSTANEGSLLAAAAIDVGVGTGDPSSSASLLVDVDNLLPGTVVERCLVVTYRGSIDDVDIRLAGRRDAGTGLEDYLDTTIETGLGSDPACTDFAPARSAFVGPLGDLWTERGMFERAVHVADAVASGSQTTVRIALELRSDDAAQGRETTFWMTIEARP